MHGVMGIAGSGILAEAEDELERVGGLVPVPRVAPGVEVVGQAGLFEPRGQVRRCVAVTEEFGEGAA